MPGHAVEVLGSSRYVSLTTFRRDGRAVATPVWIARDGDLLYVITDSASGKVKRLRHTPRVVLAPCDMRGRVTGSAVEGTARLLDDTATRAVGSLIDAKYGVWARAIGMLDRLRRRSGSRIGIEITA